MADTHLIEVRAGRAEPPSLELRPGVELAPLSVGSGGAWQVTAPGVRPVHLYIYFDGQTLFLQSAEPSDPPQMDGRPLPAAWTPATPRCAITFGQARLAFRPADVASSDATIAQPAQEHRVPDPPPRAPPKPPVGAATVAMQQAPALPARPFKPGAFVAGAGDGESTRLQPVDMEESAPSSDATRVEPLGAAGMAAPMAVRPAAGTPWSRPPPGPTIALSAVAPPPAGFAPARPFAAQPAPFQAAQPSAPPSSGKPAHDGPPSGLLNVPPPSVGKPDAPETFPQMVGREWASAPPLRKALFAMMPIAVFLALWLVLAGAPQPQPQAQPRTQPSATPSAPPTAPTAAQAPPAWPASDPLLAPVPPPLPPPPPVASGGRPGLGTPVVPPSATAGVAAAAGDAGANVDRRERQAADFVATHAYDQAIRLYDQLASERPQNPAFHEAARILRGKLEAGTP